MLVLMTGHAVVRAAFPGANGKILFQWQGAGLTDQVVVNPDGTRLVFESQRDDPGREVYVMDADGASLVQVTFDPALDGQPTWSPDGTKLAFTSTRDGIAEVYVSNTDGTAPERVTSRRRPRSDRCSGALTNPAVESTAARG